MVGGTKNLLSKDLEVWGKQGKEEVTPGYLEKVRERNMAHH